MTRSPSTHGRTWRLLAGGAAFGLLGLTAAWVGWPTGQPSNTEPVPDRSDDPRVTYTGPFRNVHPDVKYVGDAVCASCHADHAASYAKHPMARAMAPVAAATPIERYDPPARNPFQAGELWYEIRRDRGRVIHREWATATESRAGFEVAAEVHYAIGTGAKARSYAVDRAGFLFQSPATWFPGGDRWDLSPSYELRNWHFTRPLAPACLFCHCNYADHVPGTENRYRPPVFHGFGIGCERCHGPGELHVAARERGDPMAGAADYTIVNPARLEHTLREAVCQQCHLQGEDRVKGRGRGDWDFRPGLPLHPFVMVFSDARAGGIEHKFVTSVEQMMASRCYKESREPRKLGCTSCHDPHAVPAGEAARLAHYRSRCLTCHTDQSCSLPLGTRRKQQKDDSCIACHMPQAGSDVSHASFTNHAIPRLPPKRDAATDTRRPTPGPGDLVPFPGHRILPGDPDAARNLGLAQVNMLSRGLPRTVARNYAAAALPLLDQAVARHPTDWPAVESRADALWLLDRKEEAWAAYASAVAARPDSEGTRSAAGTLALEMGRREVARDHLEQAIRINPWRANYRHQLAVAYFRLGDWARATVDCLEALRLEPSRAATRSLLVQTYLWDGRADKAATEFDILQRITPDDKRAELDRWYRDEKDRAAGRGGPR